METGLISLEVFQSNQGTPLTFPGIADRCFILTELGIVEDKPILIATKRYKNLQMPGNTWKN